MSASNSPEDQMTPQDFVDAARIHLQAAWELLNSAIEHDDWYYHVKRGEMADVALEPLEDAIDALRPYTAEEVAEIDEETRRSDELAALNAKVVPLFPVHRR